MFKTFFMISVCTAILLWYLHEYHNAKFIEVTRNIPYLTPLMTKVHIWLSTGSKEAHETKVRLFTETELLEYNGERGSKGIYISILGKVYDVGKGKKHYGPGGTYHVFAGKDASRSFVTGDFTATGGTDHVLDLSFSELISLRDWSSFYDNEYVYKGKLIGRFYGQSGEKTKYSQDLDNKLSQADAKKNLEKESEMQFPPCNVEWDASSGTRVWCSTKSGGIERSWVGVPRKLYKVGSDSYRCACVNVEEVQNPNSPLFARRGHLLAYENCHELQSSCFVKE